MTIDPAEPRQARCARLTGGDGRVPGRRDLELISVVRALDAESRLGLHRPPFLTWLAADYPELFGAADLDKRLWLYALAYTIRHIIFWPPDRAETDGLEAVHPLHTLRRLIDAPLPFPAGGPRAV